MQSGPQNVIMGEDFGTELPEMQVPEQDLTNERSMARFSKTEEFKRLKKHLEERIEFYQAYLPDGREIGTTMPTKEDWIVANRVIAEFKLVLSAYEQAKEAVESVQR